MMGRTPAPRASLASRHWLLCALAIFLVVIAAPPLVAQDEASPAPPLRFAPADDATASQLRSELAQSLNQHVRSYEETSSSLFLDLYAPDPLIFVDGMPLITDRVGLTAYFNGVAGQIEDVPDVRILSNHTWNLGDTVYEVAQVAFSVKILGLPNLSIDYQKGLSIYLRQPDGSLLIHWECWSPERLPGSADPAPAPAFDDVVLTAQTQPQPAPAAAAPAPAFAEIRRLENDFHQLFLDGRHREAVSYYADDAVLLPWGDSPLTGRDAILRHVLDTPGELLAIDQEIIDLEGDNRLVRVANHFEWTVRDPATGEQATFPGKGIHVWILTDAGWKLLIDIFNLDVPLPPPDRP